MSAMATARNRMAGFSAIEIMVVLAIAGILAAIAAPNMAKMIQTQRLKSTAFDVFASVTLARSEALKRNKAVTITPEGGNWKDGWTITDSSDNVLKTQTGLDDNSVVMDGPASIVFAANGRLSAAVAPISLTDEDLDASAYRCITIDLSGRPTTREGVC